MVVTGTVLGGTVPGWKFWTDDPDEYAIGVDDAVEHDGHATGFLRSLVEQPAMGGRVELRRSLNPARYRGKRLRVRALIKADRVEWAALSGSVEVGCNPDFHDDEIRGSSDWTPHEIALDVWAATRAIEYEVRLYGGGQVWIDGVRVDVVGDATPPSTGARTGADHGCCTKGDLPY
ncbi:MAG: hypothetical protein ABSE49_33270 [Polyangiaceae bacterium]|jgi:hypothetical protein